ncbi:hypothetical protein [Burkholderia lata]|uniref:hypothetical protein n=1 Tax=Burkholderia lata (strain ATCC 17760 / DSM 23089 / LMG 22485 / NCIMB 9086 / R18194 / 383) TaxID=482957 RepID=UPI0020C730E1|nr:hypothetical protein [Burkholderia lata]
MRVGGVTPTRRHAADARRTPPSGVPGWLRCVLAPTLAVAGDDDDVTGCGSSGCVAGRIAGVRLEVEAGGSRPMLFRASPASVSRALKCLACRT